MYSVYSGLLIQIIKSNVYTGAMQCVNYHFNIIHLLILSLLP